MNQLVFAMDELRHISLDQMVGRVTGAEAEAEQHELRRRREQEAIDRERGALADPGGPSMPAPVSLRAPRHHGGPAATTRGSPWPRWLDSRHTAAAGARLLARLIEWPALLVLLAWPTQWARDLCAWDDEAGARVLRARLDRWATRTLRQMVRLGTVLAVALAVVWLLNDVRVNRRHSLLMRAVGRGSGGRLGQGNGSSTPTVDELRDELSVAGRLTSILPTIDLMHYDHAPLALVHREGEIAWLEAQPVVAVAADELAAGRLRGVETFDERLAELPLGRLADRLHQQLALGDGQASCLGADQIGVPRCIAVIGSDDAGATGWLASLTACDTTLLNPRLVSTAEPVPFAPLYGPWAEEGGRRLRESDGRRTAAYRELVVEYTPVGAGTGTAQCTLVGTPAMCLQRTLERWSKRPPQTPP
jgi:hypothetical protein